MVPVVPGPGKILHSRGCLLCKLGDPREVTAVSDESMSPDSQEKKAINHHLQSVAMGVKNHFP